MTILGLVAAAVGYVLAIAGAIAVTQGAPEPKLPGTVSVGVDKWVTTTDAERFERWKRRSRWAQPVIILGTTLQLVGTLIMALATRG
ncbi:MAG: hypothetical protein WD825_14435 [Gemmatimonadaceae bacterium]